VTLFVQGMVFGTMLATGMVLGTWFDLFRFISRRSKTAFLHLLDLLFWAVTTCVVFVVLININFLELRAYVFVSLALGFILYLKFLSRYVLRLYTWAFKTVVKVIQWTLQVARPLGIPLRFAAGILDNLILLLLNGVAWLAVRVRVLRKEQDNPPTA